MGFSINCSWVLIWVAIGSLIAENLENKGFQRFVNRLRVPYGSPKKTVVQRTTVFLLPSVNLGGLEGGSRFTGVKRFASRGWINDSPKAKAAINNCRAGRLR